MKKIFFINPFNTFKNRLKLRTGLEIEELEHSNANTFVDAALLKNANCLEKDSEILIVRTNCDVNSELLDLFPKCKMILRAGHGFDNIDVAECTRRQIYVFTTTGVFTDATADLTLGHILNSVRKIYDANASMHKKLWEREKFTGIELAGTKIGLIGMGSVGSAVARRLLAFGCEVIVYDPYKNPNIAHISKISELESQLYKTQAMDCELLKSVRFMDLYDLLSESDIVSLHAPLTVETLQIIGKQELMMMKPSAILINTARGKLVNEDALFETLQSGKIKAAALDTFAVEPATDSKLLELPNVHATPHLGSRTTASIERAIARSEEILDAVLIHNDFSDALNYNFI